MVWPTLGSRTAKEQNRTVQCELLVVAFRCGVATCEVGVASQVVLLCAAWTYVNCHFQSPKICSHFCTFSHIWGRKGVFESWLNFAWSRIPNYPCKFGGYRFRHFRNLVGSNFPLIHWFALSLQHSGLSCHHVISALHRLLGSPNPMVVLPCGAGAPLFPLVHLLPHLSPLTFVFLSLASFFFCPSFPFYQNSPTLFPGRRS